MGHPPGLLTYVSFFEGSVHGAAAVFRNQESLNSFLDLLFRTKPAGLHCEIKEFDPPSLVPPLDRPVVIVGAPRSGTTMLFATLAKCPNCWTIGGEDHTVIESVRGKSDKQGNRLEAADADPESCRIIETAFRSALRNRDGRFHIDGGGSAGETDIRFLEKTPKNSLRVSFLRSLFPNCRFVFLYREPQSNIGSLIDGWNSRKFTSYRLDDGFEWKFLLPPGWRDLLGKPVAEIAAAQWKAANACILQDLAHIPREHWVLVRYERLVSQPREEIRRICDFTALEMDAVVEELFKQPLPLSGSTLTPPSADKWRRHEEALIHLMPSIENIPTAVSRLEAGQ